MHHSSTVSPVYILVLAVAAIAPAIYLMRYIDRQDSAEKEPGGLLFRLMCMGFLSALLAMFLEQLTDTYLLNQFVYPSYTVYFIVVAISVGLIEEGCKYLFLYLNTWKNPNFNYRFDGIVYAAFVSLGFALLENVLYVFSYGLEVAGPRAILAVPGHLGFSVYMGYFYSRAKLADDLRIRSSRKSNLIFAYLVPAFLHAFYDATAMIQTPSAVYAYLAFVIIMYIVVIRLIHSEAASDTEI